MLKSMLITLLIFILPFLYFIDEKAYDKIYVFLKIFLFITIIIILDNGFSNLKKRKWYTENLSL